ncbi:MAG: hypothetical protein CUN56_08575 [Phototrophicales bacterium]|nr:MAG: hypothetical protein CUN56_08575 [Phototrophicales bacterium]RMG69888.1 MAG: VWA domain-containing protein [Chloroflexota bacterium]
MNFLTPVAFLGGLLAIPIILMYMLRLRRREVPISSTFLWQQVLQDTEANTPWQRLRRNLLLILQLIILAFIVLALARPFMTVQAVSAGQVTVLLDASASMQANDMDGGHTRFEIAQQEALNIVETLSAGDRMTVIRVAEVPEVLASSTTDRSLLRDVIRTARVSSAQSDWNAALNLAVSGLAGAEDFTMVIIGDGGLPPGTGIPGSNVELIYIPVGNSGDNIAITALATRALPGQPPELYARITNFSETEARVVFTLFVDGERFVTQNQTVPPNSSLPVISSALPDGFEFIQATLTKSVNSIAQDYLTIDNTAYAVSGHDHIRRVLLVTSGNIYIEQVLRSLPGLNTVRAEGTGSIPDGYDLYIFDQVVPQNLPQGDLLFINPQEDSPFFTRMAESQNTQNPIVLDPADPRMTYVDVSQLHVLKLTQLANVEWADPLIMVDGGALLLAGEVDGRQIAVMPFNLRESDLPLQVTWPILMANLAEWFTPRTVIDITDSLSVGESLAIHPPFETDVVRITAPDEQVYELPFERDTVVFAATTHPGFYQLELLKDGQLIGSQQFAVNLFSLLESAIQPVSIDNLIVEGTQISVGIQDELGQRELWSYVIVLALLFLLIEWYAYHRQMRVPTVFRPISGRKLQAAS